VVVAAAVEFGIRGTGGKMSRVQFLLERNDIKKDRRLTLMNRGNDIGSRRRPVWFPCFWWRKVLSEIR